MPSNHGTLRILDASLNRASEGLRVVEDYVRFVLDDDHLSGQLKQLRHDLGQAAAWVLDAERHNARDTPGDVGTTISASDEAQRTDPWDACMAGCERTKQSLRSLEEFSKINCTDAVACFEALRYRFYTIESAVVRTVRSIDQLAGVRLYVLIDGRQSPDAFAALVDQLIKGGASAIQLRDKRLSDRDLLDRAKTLVRMTLTAVRKSASTTDSDDAPAAKRTLSIINDRADVAAAADADGVHLGQDDFHVTDARKVLGPHKLIGVSTHCIEQARTAVIDGANYLGAGPTFPSETKPFDELAGLDYLRAVAAEVRLATFAIGGVTPENLPDVLAAGISRAAVGAAVTEADKPAVAASTLLSMLEESSGADLEPR